MLTTARLWVLVLWRNVCGRYPNSPERGSSNHSGTITTAGAQWISRQHGLQNRGGSQARAPLWLQLHCAAPWAILFLPQLLWSATFTVTNVENSGPGSLRQAITDANATPERDTIEFNLPEEGTHTITLTSALPRISAPVIIDGTTEPGYAGQPIIELDGTRVNGANGLHIMSGNCVVRGLVINNFGGTSGGGGQAAIYLETRGTNVIEGNFIGTDMTGTFAFGGRQNGIFIVNSSNNLVGGTSPRSRNLISGNAFVGVTIQFNAARNRVQGNLIGTDITGTVALGNVAGGVVVRGNDNLIGGTAPEEGNVIAGNGASGLNLFANGNIIQGNFIGTDATGLVALGNLSDGITIDGGSSNVIGGTLEFARNVISGNTFSGILIRSGAFGTQIQGNFIGTDAFGRIILGNGDDGIFLSGSRDNTIGGTDSAARNIISGNRPSGIEISGVNARRNVVLGNFIGADATGTVPLRNSGSGVVITDAPNNTIGGTNRSARNLISGNGQYGIEIYGTSARSNLIAGNFIGTDLAGTMDLKNRSHGIYINSGASTNVVGGLAREAGNTIAFNGGDGVTVEQGAGNAIRGNAIFSNAGLGIDLFPKGPSPNDADDADSGGNNLQNYPVLIAAASGGGNLTISGVLNGVPNAVLQLEFFSNPSRDPTGYGEGQNFLGSLTVTNSAKGEVSFAAGFPLLVSSDPFISATATDSSGNTSEFAKCVTVSAGVAGVKLMAAKSGNGNELTLSWPAAEKNVVLEQTENLSPVIVWAAVTNLPVVVGDSSTLRIAPLSKSKFYRIRRP